MEIGDMIEATVTHIHHFGIFLDAGGQSGLLRIPDISNRRVVHPGEYAAVGDVLKVKIIGFDAKNGQFVASRRVLHPEEKPTD
jgi:ribosomal protein S1